MVVEKEEIGKTMNKSSKTERYFETVLWSSCKDLLKE